MTQHTTHLPETLQPNPNVPYWLQLERDGQDRIIARTETMDGVKTRWEYEYDSAGRVQRVRVNGEVLEEYKYDRQGRRIHDKSMLRGCTGRAFKYSRRDELLDCAAASFEYDAHGFLAEKRHAGFVTRYRYNPDWTLARVDLPDGRVVMYHHMDGQRVARFVNGEVAERYAWDGPRLTHWLDARDGMYVEFEYAGDKARLPFAMRDGSGRYFLTYDQIGSLKAVADANGNSVKVITYDTFGNVIAESAPQLVLPIGFAGGLRDADTELVRFGIRDYDPLFGRFTARDPLGEAAGDPDVYGYCLDDPVNAVDSTGFFALPMPSPMPLPLPPVFIPGSPENDEFTRGTIDGIRKWGDLFQGWIGDEDTPAHVHERKGKNKKKNRPPNPNKRPKKTPPKKQDIELDPDRERNVKHPDGEEHSRRAKGQRKRRGQRGAPVFVPPWPMMTIERTENENHL